MAAHYVGIKILNVTGRECVATKRQADEMHVDYLYQNVKNKKEFIRDFMKEHDLTKNPFEEFLPKARGRLCDQESHLFFVQIIL